MNRREFMALSGLTAADLAWRATAALDWRLRPQPQLQNLTLLFASLLFGWTWRPAP